MKLSLFTCLICLALLGSAVHAQAGQLMPTDLFTGVVFSGEDYSFPEMLQNLGYGVGEDVVAAWTPTAEDVLGLETAFIIYLKETTDARASDILNKNRLHEYKRQYIGVDLKDQHLIFATFDGCTNITDEELVNEFITFLPNDGGICFIELLFDPVAKSFYRLYIHGEA
jgi:hypothetical protein